MIIVNTGKRSGNLTEKDFIQLMKKKKDHQESNFQGLGNIIKKIIHIIMNIGKK